MAFKSVGCDVCMMVIVIYVVFKVYGVCILYYYIIIIIIIIYIFLGGLLWSVQCCTCGDLLR